MVDYQLSQIAIMHHVNGHSQQEISQLLGISKMTVSRMLQKAKDQKIIQTTVKMPFDLDEDIEKKIRKQYKLGQVKVVLPPEDEDDDQIIMDFTAKAAAFFLTTDPPSHTTIGIGVGRTISRVVESLIPIKTEQNRIVQLMGGLPEVSNQNPFSLVQEICRRWASQGTYLTSFAAAEDQTSRDNFLHSSEMGKMVCGLWEKCDLAILGVGTITHGTLLSPQLVGEEEIEKLKAAGALGDVLGHCFNAQGDFIQSGLENRLLSIPLKTFLKIKRRLGVVSGIRKAPALAGALKTGAITELVTDKRTATALLAIAN